MCGLVEVKGERWGQTWLFHGTSTSTSEQGQKLANGQGQELAGEQEQEQGQKLVKGQGLFCCGQTVGGVGGVGGVCRVGRVYIVYIRKLCGVYCCCTY